MSKYILSCCSTADLSKEYFESRDIHYICFPICWVIPAIPMIWDRASRFMSSMPVWRQAK